MINTQKRMKEYISSNVIYVILFSIISILLFWKCRYGYTYLDEAFYPTIAYRFIQGDAILNEEWSNTQLSNLILIPVLKCYIAIRGNLDGIYLTIRFLYTVCKIFISIFVYFKLRQFDEWSAKAASLMFLVFAGYGMMVLSYNSVASGGLLCALLFCINRESDCSRKKIVSYIFAGISLSIAVLAQPYLAGIYVLYAFFMIGKRIACKNKVEKTPELYTERAFWGITLGIALSIVPFLFYVFSKTDIHSMMQTLPHIISGDPAHPKKSFYALTLAYLVRITMDYNRNKYLLSVYGVIFIYMVIACLDKKRKSRINYYVVIANILCLVLMGTYICTANYINYIIWIPNVLAFILYVLEHDQHMNDIFQTLWIPGMIYTYLEYLASNTGFSGISSASCVAAVGSVVLIGMLAKKSNLVWRIPIKVLKGFVVITTLILLYYRMTYVFWEDGGMASLTKQIQFGPDAGLIVAERQYNYYEDIYRDTEEIRQMPSETKVVFLSDKSLWLAGTQRCATYSPLCYSITNTELLYQYYEEHPEKKSDVIYVDHTYGQEVAIQVADRLDMTIREKGTGWFLEGKK